MSLVRKCSQIWTLLFADDVSVMAEMLEVLILALELMNEESSAMGLEINWSKTKIQASDIIVGAILGHRLRSMWLIPSSISVHRLMLVGETILIFVEELSRHVHA